MDADECRLSRFFRQRRIRLGGKYKKLTEKIIKIFYIVYNKLGYGFLEKVYEKAMMIELKKEGIPAAAQSAIKVFYEGEIIGEYAADMLVDNTVIVEIKASKRLVEDNEAQVLNYLKATNIEVGLLLNFEPKPEVRRKAFDNSRKWSAGYGFIGFFNPDLSA